MTLALPAPVYEGLERRARQHQRRIEDEAALTLAASVGVDDTLPDDLVAAIATLSTLDDDALQRVSRSQPTVEDGVLLDALADKQRRQALTPAEERMLAVLIDRHDRVMVLRAEAVALLKERGGDVQGRVAGA
jgi:hypothetical protein